MMDVLIRVITHVVLYDVESWDMVSQARNIYRHERVFQTMVTLRYRNLIVFI